MFYFLEFIKQSCANNLNTLLANNRATERISRKKAKFGRSILTFLEVKSAKMAQPIIVLFRKSKSEDNKYNHKNSHAFQMSSAPKNWSYIYSFLLYKSNIILRMITRYNQIIYSLKRNCQTRGHHV